MMPSGPGVVLRVERWLFAPGDPRRLAAVRIGLAAILAERMARDVYVQLAEQPPALFRPLSFMRLLDSMPSKPVVVAVQATGIALAVAAVGGLYGRVSLAGAWACALFLGGMTTSTGKVVHNDVVLLLAMVPLLAARHSDVWSVDGLRHRTERRFDAGRSARSGWPVRTAMVTTAGAYFFSGLAKLMFSGPAWFASDNLRFALYASSDAQPDPNGLGLFIADRPWVAHLVAFAVLAFELSFPLVLWRPRLVSLFVPGVFLLHAGIGATLRLDYSPWAFTVAVVFIDWPAMVDRVRSTSRSRSGKRRLLRSSSWSAPS